MSWTAGRRRFCGRDASPWRRVDDSTAPCAQSVTHVDPRTWRCRRCRPRLARRPGHIGPGHSSSCSSRPSSHFLPPPPPRPPRPSASSSSSSPSGRRRRHPPASAPSLQSQRRRRRGWLDSTCRSGRQARHWPSMRLASHTRRPHAGEKAPAADLAPPAAALLGPPPGAPPAYYVLIFGQGLALPAEGCAASALQTHPHTLDRHRSYPTRRPPPLHTHLSSGGCRG